MYLHQIELHGFKSFADRTAVQFDPGVTAIVGPNGCGKSNIIDAVRWVLGEQRARLLRSEKMENVIFNGTATRRALGLAEATLTIHNTRGVLPTEYTDVTVGRRLYRSGESEYVLNGAVCRLKDILDLFMDTGMGPGAYSVIELKMIEDILSESPQDRRRLFEEAAGITKYKLRRAQALRRLDATQADLTRLTDLTDEIAKRVQSLRRQAKKAERFHELKARLRALELGLAHADYARLADERDAVSGQAGTLERLVAERTAHLQRHEAQSAALQAALVEREGALREAQAALNRQTERIRRAEAEAALAAERRAAAAAALDRLAREADADAERRATLGSESAALDAAIAEADVLLAEAEAAEAEARRLADARRAAAEAVRARLAEADAEARRQEAAQREAERALDAREGRRALLQQEVERLTQQREDAAAGLDGLQADAERAETGHAEAQRRLAGAESTYTKAEAARADLDARIGPAEEALQAARRRHDAARAEADVLGSLLESLDGLSDAAQTLLAEPDWAAAPRTVADLLVCPADLRAAVGAALGPLADGVVVNTEAEARAGIERLQSEGAGRATFLVLERLPERGPQVLSPTPPGARPLGADVEVADPAHRRLVRLLLANHFVVNGLEEAASLQAQYPVARFVTPAGEWLSAGILRAGGDEGAGSAERLGRAEQHEAAEAAAAEAAAEIEQLEERLGRLRTGRDALGLDAARDAVREAERAAAEAERAAQAARLSLEAEVRRRDEGAARLSELHDQLDAAQATGEQEEALGEARRAAEAAAEQRDAVRAEAATAEAEARVALDQLGEARVFAAQARATAEAARRDRDRARQAAADLDTRATARAAERERVEAARTEAEAMESERAGGAAGLRGDLDRLTAALREAEGALSEARSAISDTDALLREVRRLREEAQAQQSAGRIRLAELQARIEALAERVWGEYGVALPELAEPDEDFDAQAAREETPALRDRLRTLGAVNELALETYEEEKERLDFLLEQQRDLEGAETSLRSTIREINATARARFEETFGAVRTQFQRLFEDLFGENASADLVLAGDDPLEDDVEIRARPKGKKPSGIAQLSGGEKTLTAIALLFAIYLVKPSPFCILDEVDAPLDDANVERFMRLIRTFSETTQFILVTHNKLTMEAADRMYGVTMQEEGVSRLVGVQFSEALPEMA